MPPIHIATIFTPKYFFNCACRDLGLEDEHTIAIARVNELWQKGLITTQEGELLCRATYFRGLGAHQAIED